MRIMIAENGTAVAVTPRPALRLFYETLALPAALQAPFNVTRERKRRDSVLAQHAPAGGDQVQNRSAEVSSGNVRPSSLLAAASLSTIG